MRAIGVMRTLRLSLALLVAIAVFFLFEPRDASTVHVLTGDVVDWQPGRLITVVNEQTDPRGVRIGLPATDRDADRGAIRSGVRVAVSYRVVGESYPVAVKLLVLDTSNERR